MGKESRKFGAPGFTARERRILSLQDLAARTGRAWIKWRYRDRLATGPGCRVDPWSVVIRGTGSVELGDGSVIERGFHKACFNLGESSRIRLGKRTWIQTYDQSVTFSTKPGAVIEAGDDCWFSGGLYGASQRITIGDHTLIGWGCMILDSNMHRMDNQSAPERPEPIEIGSHVWMPSYVTVLKGVKIGDHCVIGTGSLVCRDIPSNSFAAGRPAKIIRSIGDRDAVE